MDLRLTFHTTDEKADAEDVERSALLASRGMTELTPPAARAPCPSPSRYEQHPRESLCSALI